jgi:hypothetical protein
VCSRSIVGVTSLPPTPPKKQRGAKHSGGIGMRRLAGRPRAIRIVRHPGGGRQDARRRHQLGISLSSYRRAISTLIGLPSSPGNGAKFTTIRRASPHSLDAAAFATGVSACKPRIPSIGADVQAPRPHTHRRSMPGSSRQSLPGGHAFSPPTLHSTIVLGRESILVCRDGDSQLTVAVVANYN